MARNTTVTLTAGSWTELTDADVQEVTFQNISSSYVLVQGTTGSAPSAKAGSLRYNPGQGERNMPLSYLWPGVSGVVRLWAYSDQNVEVMISHA